MTGRITIDLFTTLDGVAQAPGGPEEDTSNGFPYGGWQAPFPDRVLGQQIGAGIDAMDALVLGRRTYDIFAGYWPHVTGEEGGVVGERLNRLPKYVATNRTDELTWSGAQRLEGNLATAVAELKARPGAELQVHGSGALAHSLMAEGLIDVYRTLVFPVVLGRGLRLFAEGAPPAGLRLTDHRTSRTGVTMLTYESAGAPAFGSMGA